MGSRKCGGAAEEERVAAGVAVEQAEATAGKSAGLNDHGVISRRADHGVVSSLAAKEGVAAKTPADETRLADPAGSIKQGEAGLVSLDAQGVVARASDKGVDSKRLSVGSQENLVAYWPRKIGDGAEVLHSGRCHGGEEAVGKIDRGRGVVDPERVVRRGEGGESDGVRGESGGLGCRGDQENVVASASDNRVLTESGHQGVGPGASDKGVALK